MPRARDYVPQHCHHKPTGRGYVRIDGRQVYTGRWGSAEASAKYDRVVAEWMAGGREGSRAGPDGLTVAGLAAEWRRSVQAKTTGAAVRAARQVEADVAAKFGKLPAGKFGPKCLKAMRETWRDRVSRRMVNKYASLVRRMFKWGVAEELVPVEAWHALLAVDPVTAGTPGYREREAVAPVDDETIERTLPHVRKTIAAMVRVQRLTGMRPGEVCSMRPCDLDRSGEVWIYRPGSHKKKWRGKSRDVAVGPRAAAILVPYLDRQPDPAGAVFRPRGRNHAYKTNEYNRSIWVACKRHGLPSWGVNRLRHAAATEIRRKYGLEAAQAVLGHDRADVTQIYAARNLEAAIAIAREIG